ncbi:MAG: hypothetical protein ACTSWY_11165, partial [Promethearchaeota archaeon]
MGPLTEKYRFIRNDVFLCPYLDKKTNRPKLKIQKINPKTGDVELEDQIYCIHTAVTDVSPEEFNRYQEDLDYAEKFDNKTLKIRSSEGLNLKKINLTAEDRLFALRSWVQGIAEAGMDAFKLQGEIDRVANLQYPILDFLMRFLIKADPESDFIFDYLQKIEKECVFEGERHDVSMIA